MSTRRAELRRAPQREAAPARERCEQALIREAQDGSDTALEELFRRHWRRARAAALRVTGDPAIAEDVAQETFMAAMRALDRFERGRAFGPWVGRIAANRAIDEVRARSRRGEIPLTGAPERADEPPQLSREMLAALAELSPPHREVVVLRHLLGYTPTEVALRLDLARGTVNSRLRRALDRLRDPVAARLGG